MSWTQHIRHPSQVVAMGQIVDAVILSLDKDEKKISLGMKQLEPDPWESFCKNIRLVQSIAALHATSQTSACLLNFEPGVDGLVHISDLSWTKKIRHPGEVVKKGEKIDVVVFGVDIEQRKISLGHKQVFR